MTSTSTEATAEATAAASGASATERFQRDKQITATVSQERVSTLATDLLTAVHDVVRRHRATYEEYNALKAWLIRVGEDGEWPLFLDVWVEHVLEEVVNSSREGTKGTIEGPYYVPRAPSLPADADLPHREGERGTPLLFQGQVRDLDGRPVPAATIEVWHADDEGYYSQFAPGIPEWNLRASVVADGDGTFRIRTIQPAPYQIPTDGACGALITAAGWHAWRPAHLHLKVSAPGSRTITTQLYFAGGQHVDDDIAQAVKPELVLTPQPAADGSGHEVTYDFVLDPA
ncbi:catechol 1,2-dioxygenase [Kineococcus sp. R8]|uniref:catechol 1,2-dioxygenase n=1 Tax=Kineococcus siccus TaxID=2696567 RepID=UPI001412E875|nr:catechol 1,2-dioxygenase [Kineococcus siccus]NAZ80409.1 catechol 1,2-dioxygenase [Kineococcus siccus]